MNSPITAEKPPLAQPGHPPAIDHVAVARGLAEVFEGQAAAVQANTSLNPAVVEALSQSKLFWMSVPTELGGGGAGFVELLETIEEISRADGSIGWSFMANSISTAVAAAMVGDRAIDAMFGGGKMPLVAGMLGPGGKSRQVEGGYLAGGKFSFGSGSGHADWIGGGMLVMDGDKPRLLPSGVPQVQICFVPQKDVEFLGNWDVTGMVGTGSYDYRIPEQFVPEDFTYERSSLDCRRGGARFSGGIQALSSVGHAGVALGLLKRGMDEIVQIAATKKRIGMGGVIADGEQFRYEFGMAEAAYQAARDLTVRVSRESDAAAARGERLSPENRARHRIVTTWLHKAGEDVMRFCHSWAGSEAIRATTPISRLSRDWAVIAQHIWVDPSTITGNAPVVLEQWRR